MSPSPVRSRSPGSRPPAACRDRYRAARSRTLRAPCPNCPFSVKPGYLGSDAWVVENVGLAHLSAPAAACRARSRGFFCHERRRRRDRDGLLHHARVRVGPHRSTRIVDDSGQALAALLAGGGRALPGPARARPRPALLELAERVGVRLGRRPDSCGRTTSSSLHHPCRSPSAADLGYLLAVPFAACAMASLLPEEIAPDGARPDRRRLADRRDLFAVRRVVRAARHPLPIRERIADPQPGRRRSRIPSATSRCSPW